MLFDVRFCSYPLYQYNFVTVNTKQHYLYAYW